MRNVRACMYICIFYKHMYMFFFTYFKQEILDKSLNLRVYLVYGYRAMVPPF